MARLLGHGDGLQRDLQIANQFVQRFFELVEDVVVLDLLDQFAFERLSKAMQVVGTDGATEPLDGVDHTDGLLEAVFFEHLAEFYGALAVVADKTLNNLEVKRHGVVRMVEARRRVEIADLLEMHDKVGLFVVRLRRRQKLDSRLLLGALARNVQELGQFLVKERRVNRLDNVGVHPRLDTFILVFLESTGAHGQNRNLLEVLVIFLADELCRGKAVHHGHLDIHEHQVERVLREHLDSLLAVFGHHGGKPDAVQERHGKFLVHQVVLDEQDFCFLEVYLALFFLDLLLIGEVDSERLLHGAQQVHHLDGLGNTGVVMQLFGGNSRIRLVKVDGMHENFRDIPHGFRQTVNKVEPAEERHLVIDNVQVVRSLARFFVRLDEVESLVDGHGLFDNTLEPLEQVAQHLAQFGTVVDQQNVLVPKRIFALPLGRSTLLSYGERETEVELGAHARRTFDIELPAHEFHERLADDKPEARSAVLARCRAVRLGKGGEEFVDLFGRHADTRIRDADGKPHVRIRRLFELDAERDVALLGKLRRVVDEVRENLREAQRVAQEDFGNVGVHVDDEFNRFRGDTDLGKRRDLADDVVQHELRDFEFLLFRLDLGEVENVVDDAEQRLGRMPDTVHETALAVVEVGFGNQVDHADDGVHRSADFMAHVREELALGLRRLLGDFTGRDHLGNIGHRKHVAHHGLLRLERHGLAAEPDFAAVREREHEGILPGILEAERLPDRLAHGFGQAKILEPVERNPDKVAPVLVEDVRNLLGHVLDILVPVEDNQQRPVARKQDGIQDGIFLDSARLIVNHEEVTDGAVVLDKNLETDFPPDFFAALVRYRNNNLAFARVKVAAHGHAVGKMLELVRRNVVKEDLPLQVLTVVVKERLDVRTRMQNVVGVVCQYERKVRAAEQRIEQRTRTHALAKVLFDEYAEQHPRYKNRERDQQQHDERHDELHGRKILLEAHDHLVLLQHMDHVERRVAHPDNHEHQVLSMDVRLFDADYLSALERIDVEGVLDKTEQIKNRVLRNPPRIEHVGEMGKDVVVLRIYKDGDAAFFAGHLPHAVTQLVQAEIFGNHAPDIFRLVPDRHGKRHHGLLFVPDRLQDRAGDGKSVVTGGLEVPALGTEFGIVLFELDIARTDKLAVGRPVVGVKDPASGLRMLDELALDGIYPGDPRKPLGQLDKIVAEGG